MNATCSEFIVCQSETHSPLILSEFTGSAGSLGAAISVNPWDYSDVAHSIHHAITMTKEEKVNRHQQLMDQVTCHSASFWAHSFIKELVFTSWHIKLNLTSKDKTIKISNQLVCTPQFNKERAKELYQTSSHRLILLDYDVFDYNSILRDII